MNYSKATVNCTESIDFKSHAFLGSQTVDKKENCIQFFYINIKKKNKESDLKINKNY